MAAPKLSPYPVADDVLATREGRPTKIGRTWRFWLDDLVKSVRSLNEFTDAVLATLGVFAYSEGAFTPTLTFGGVNTGITYGEQTGYWIKQGRQITYWFRVTLTSKGAAAGAVGIDGWPLMPFFDGVAPPTAVIGYALNFAGLTSPLTGYLTNTPRLLLYHWGATGISPIDNTHCTNTSDVIGVITYRVAA